MMAVSWHSADELPRPASSSEDEGDEDTGHRPYVPRQYTARVFGVTAVGASVCLTLTGFEPFFFVRVEDAWGAQGPQRLRGWLSEAKGPGWRVVCAQLVRRKDYLGFQNGTLSAFVKVSFSQQFAMRQLSKRLLSGLNSDGGALDLTCAGLPHRGGLRVYESNVDPILRLMHLRSIAPAGWLQVRAGAWSNNLTGAESSSCQLDAECPWSDLHAMQDSDSIAPLVVFSLDIECGSSHGDFPQAKKGLNKLGMELVQAFIHSGLRSRPAEEQAATMTSCLLKAFGLVHLSCSASASVSSVFPKFRKTERELRDTLPALALLVLAEARLPVSARGTTGCRTAIERVTEVLEGFFQRPVAGSHRAASWGAAIPQPPGLLQGDPVIQIGVTMHVYGDRSCC